MRKTTSLIIAVLLAILLFSGGKLVLERFIHHFYYDKVGDDNSLEKSQSLVLQKEAASAHDNLFIYGSSELEFSRTYATHVSNVFNHRAEGFQVYLVGRAGYEQIAHALILGAMGSHLRGQKILFILSPQWFYRQNIDGKSFAALVKPLHYYGFFQNDELSLGLKGSIAKLIMEIVPTNKYGDFDDLRFVCSLYLKNDPLTRLQRVLTRPYYWALTKVLELDDDLFAFNYLRQNKEYPKHEKGQYADLNWQTMKEMAIVRAKADSNNNRFYMEDPSYSLQMAKTPKAEGMYAKVSMRHDNLYDELEHMVQIFNELGLDPLFVNVPLHGLWTDFTQLDKNERYYFYKRVNDIIDEHHFRIVDLTDKEYEPYFFKDATHIGWVGWVYVNEAIYNYWHGAGRTN